MLYFVYYLYGLTIFIVLYEILFVIDIYIVVDYLVLHFDKVVSYNCFHYINDYFYICGDSLSPIWIPWSQ
jgi:hypothetical protein